MNIKSVIASLFALSLVQSAYADIHPAPLPKTAVRIEHVNEADFIGKWGFEEKIPYAKVINYSEIHADHTGSDDTLVTAQTGDTVKVEQTFTWSYDPDTQIFSQEVEALRQSVNGAPAEQLPTEDKQLLLTLWLVDGERVIGLSEEGGDTFYYTEIINDSMPEIQAIHHIEAKP